MADIQYVGRAILETTRFPPNSVLRSFWGRWLWIWHRMQGPIFLFVLSTCMATCLIHIPHLFPLSSTVPSLSPCHFLLYRQSYHPWECDRSHSLLCCIAFARGHRETAENLCRYSRPFNRVCPQSNSLWEMTSRSAFRSAGRGPAVIHPSTDPAKSCLTRVIAWHRTPTTHRTLSMSKCQYFIVSIVQEKYQTKIVSRLHRQSCLEIRPADGSRVLLSIFHWSNQCQSLFEPVFDCCLINIW